MKKLLFISSLIILFNSCKKETTEPSSDETSTGPTHITNYAVTVTPRMKNTQGDTLIIKINSSVVLKKFQTGIQESYIYQLKTGDNFNVYYSPGKVQNGSAIITDENGLLIFSDHDNVNGEIYNANCRCTTNFDHTFK